MRNPKWSRDELMLVLDLYFMEGQLDATDPKVIRMSAYLNKLPIHTNRNKDTKFRNPNGVAMKLGNFANHDPEYSGKGLSRGNKLEKALWNKYFKEKNLLKELTDSIIETIGTTKLVEQISTEIFDEEEISAEEGIILFRLHKVRERNPNLVKKKKSLVFKQKGKLQCEVCRFDFEVKYGERGLAFIECHHIVKLSKLKPHSKTRLEDLVLVCANCHRMLHRNGSITIKELKNLMKLT